MREDRISRTQLMALLWAGTLAPAAELLPEAVLPVAGRSAWLVPAAAGAVLWLVGGLLGRWSGGRGGARLLREGLGPVLGRLAILIYMVWGEVLLGLRLSLCARRLLAAGYRDGSLWFFVTVLAALTAWIGTGRLSAFARAGQLFLTVLLTVAAAVLVLSVSRVEVERILPLWWDDVPQLAAGTVPAAGVLGWGLFLLFLTGSVEEKRERRGWHWTLWWLGGCLLLTAAQAVIQGNLGVELARRLDAPFFALAKSVGIRGAFQRIESVVAAAWVLSDLAMAGVLVFALRAMAEQVWEGARNCRRTAGALVGIAWALALLLAPAAERWNRELVPAIHLALCATGGLFFGLAKVLCGKKCGKKQMLWWKRD